MHASSRKAGASRQGRSVFPHLQAVLWASRCSRAFGTILQKLRRAPLPTASPLLLFSDYVPLGVQGLCHPDCIGDSVPKPLGFGAYLPGLAARKRRKSGRFPIPATEVALRLHPCSAVSSTQSTCQCSGSRAGSEATAELVDPHRLLLPGRGAPFHLERTHGSISWCGLFHQQSPL